RYPRDADWRVRYPQSRLLSELEGWLWINLGADNYGLSGAQKIRTESKLLLLGRPRNRYCLPR
ncbi:MAG: hypothetical protein FWG25_11330, partial [Promicromonosporaceae bacterium]|nr:hypothetical protein [Promicromonosporaceae bacterium]